MKQALTNRVDLRRDAVCGFEALRAHFTGHPYDPHWHDSYLIGVTGQGVQQFHSRRKQHQSRPGTVLCWSRRSCMMVMPRCRQAKPPMPPP